jgi:hypothetical protein
MFKPEAIDDPLPIAPDLVLSLFKPCLSLYFPIASSPVVMM